MALDFEKRSALRKADAARRRNPPHDEHVRLFLMFPPTQRARWSCPMCSREMRVMDRPRGAGNRLKAHCGCRDWVPAGTVPFHIRHREKRAHYKRVARQKAALAQGRQLGMAFGALHDAHIRARVALMAHCNTRPHNSHVTAWRKARPSQWWAHLYRTDPAFNAKQKLRTQLRKLRLADSDLAAHMAASVKRGSGMQRWHEVLGYTIPDLVHHLQQTLPEGATWQDFLDGELHIDHIKPRASFDLTTIDAVRECWRLGNLRLLAAIDNMRKGARLEEPA